MSDKNLYEDRNDLHREILSTFIPLSCADDMTRDRQNCTTSYNYIVKYVWNTSIEGIKNQHTNPTNSLLESWKNVAMSDLESPQKHSTSLQDVLSVREMTTEFIEN